MKNTNKPKESKRSMALLALVFLLAFSCVAAGATGLTDEQKLNAYYTLITMKINSGAYDEALANIDKAMPLAGEDPLLLADLWLKRGAVQAMQGNYDDALPALQKALEYDSQAADAYLLSAQIYAEQSEALKAIEHLEHYLAIKPDDTPMYALLAELHFSLGQYKAAEQAYSKFIDAQEQVDPAALYMRGVSYMQSGRYEEAIDDFTDALDDPEQGHNARFNRAVSYMQLGRFEEAEADLTLLTDAGAAIEGLSLNRGIARMSQGKMSEAVEDFTASIDKEEQTEDALANRAACRIQLQQFEEAYDDYTSYMALTGAKDTSVYYRGIALLSMQKYEEAAGDFTVFLDEVVPQMAAGAEMADLPAWARNYRAASRMGSSMYEEAIADLTANIEEGSLKAISYYNRSLCYQALGKNDLAEEDLMMSLIQEEAPPDGPQDTGEINN